MHLEHLVKGLSGAEFFVTPKVTRHFNLFKVSLLLFLVCIRIGFFLLLLCKESRGDDKVVERTVQLGQDCPIKDLQSLFYGVSALRLDGDLLPHPGSLFKIEYT